jgi:hypothetical protein
MGKTGLHTGIMYQNSNIWFRTRYGSPAFYDTSGYSVSVLGSWLHVVGTYECNSAMKLYINGSLYSQNTSITGGLVNLDTLWIGGSSSGGYSCNVKIPIARTYNRALADWEVYQNYLCYKRRYPI